MLVTHKGAASAIDGGVQLVGMMLRVLAARGRRHSRGRLRSCEVVLAAQVRMQLRQRAGRCELVELVLAQIERAVDTRVHAARQREDDSVAEAKKAAEAHHRRATAWRGDGCGLIVCVSFEQVGE